MFLHVLHCFSFWLLLTYETKEEEEKKDGKKKKEM
jgi:hypothetical protein